MSATDRQLAMLRLVKWVCLIAGITLLLVGLVLFGRDALFLKSAHQTHARVTKIDSTRSSSGGRVTRAYRPTFEFLDASGTSRTVTLSHYSSRYNYSVGRRVAILYVPDDPNRLRVASFFGVWGVTLIVGGLGLVVLHLWPLDLDGRQRTFGKGIRHTYRARQLPAGLAPANPPQERTAAAVCFTCRRASRASAD